MCKLHVLHYHHKQPCNKGIEFDEKYEYCQNAKEELVSRPPSRTAAAADRDYEVKVTGPCKNIAFVPEYGFSNPCWAGDCETLEDCERDGCRLKELGGRWRYCRCRGRGNTFVYCPNPRKNGRSALCYHTVCNGCETDA
ncbi:hypothetical protein GGR55DRAFT_632798 [Xylaria sp. FL0064]|nr:hypothetical protein GGR55DRAFT_632798 [Xylaria sp. FL0064]